MSSITMEQCALLPAETQLRRWSLSADREVLRLLLIEDSRMDACVIRTAWRLPTTCSLTWSMSNGCQPVCPA